MDVKDESVAPWNLDGRVGEDDAPRDTPSGGGMSDVTTATGCAVSRSRARILCDKSCTYLLLLATAGAEDQRFEELVAEIVSGRNMVTKKGKRSGLIPVRESKCVDCFIRLPSMHSSSQLGSNWSADSNLNSRQYLRISLELIQRNGKCPTLSVVPLYRTFSHPNKLAQL
jgi:hypothetical protein